MQAWTTIPGRPGAELVRNVPESELAEGAVLVQTLSICVCGTDRDILAGQYGQAPEGSDYLILGHESLGRVLTAPAESGLSTGDLRGGIVCLAGISSGTRESPFNVGAFNRGMVLENDVVFGSVNANMRHYSIAAEALEHADIGWIERIITRRVPLERWSEVLDHDPRRDVKSTIQFAH